jgi:hypothetical protein
VLLLASKALVPTEAELKAETTEAEVNKVTNLSTAFNSFLRMPAAGFLNINSSNPSTGRPNVISARSKVIMWTKTSAFEASNNTGAKFNNNAGHGHGFSVRCVKD